MGFEASTFQKRSRNSAFLSLKIRSTSDSEVMHADQIYPIPYRTPQSYIITFPFMLPIHLEV